MTSDSAVVRGALEIEESGSAPVVTLRVSDREPVFAGHFPHFPVFPGVCVIDFVRRAALSTHPAPGAGRRVERVERARFLNPIRPGDRLTARLRWERMDEKWRCAAAVTTSDGPAARLSLVFAGPPAPPTAAASDSARAGHPLMTFTDIRRVLPHRYPMLLLDQVVAADWERELFARKAVTGDEPWYAPLSDEPGPASEDYPEALVIESWAQAAAVLVSGGRPPTKSLDTVPLFGSLSDARLPAPVRPGEVIDHHVRVLRRVSDTVLVEGRSTVDGRPVLEVEQMAVALRPVAALTRNPAGNGRPREAGADDRTRA